MSDFERYREQIEEPLGRPIRDAELAHVGKLSNLLPSQIDIVKTLDRAMQKFRDLGHGDVDVLGGSLADDNKANFQLEYAAARDAGLDLDAALQQAARNISFGDHRIRRGYTELEVKVVDQAKWKLLEPVKPGTDLKNLSLIRTKTRSGAAIRNQEVPQDITINARRPRT